MWKDTSKKAYLKLITRIENLVQLRDTANADKDHVEAAAAD